MCTVLLIDCFFSARYYIPGGINIEALCAASPKALAHSPTQVPASCQLRPPKWQMPLSYPVAPQSQRELHKDGGGGGGGVARRARAARAPKAKSCAMSSATSSTAVHVGLAGCARDHPCASWGSRLPTSRLNDRRLGLALVVQRRSSMRAPGPRWPLTVAIRASMPRRTRTRRDKGNSGSTRGAA